VIRVEDLHKSYRERPAVRGVSFEVQRGEIFGLLGPNGAGKTTTLSMLGTLLTPDRGEVTIAGHSLQKDAARIKATLGLVPQDLALYDRLTALENLRFFGKLYGLDAETLRRRCAEALTVVGLADRQRDLVRTFSGGMKRRLNIAVALVHRPQVLFLDEPTVGIDPQSRNFIFEFVEGLRDEGYTLLYTTHYMEEAQRLCDRVAIMDEGLLLALDSPRALIKRLGGGVIEAGFPAPELNAMAEAIAGLSTVEQLRRRDGKVAIRARDARAALADIVELCRTRDVELLGLEVLKPDLESVFLQLTGRRFRD